MRLRHSPDDSLSPRADGSEILVSLQDGERRIPDIEAVELPFSLVFIHGEIFDYCSLCIQKCPLRTQRRTKTFRTTAHTPQELLSTDKRQMKIPVLEKLG